MHDSGRWTNQRNLTARLLRGLSARVSAYPSLAVRGCVGHFDENHGPGDVHYIIAENQQLPGRP